MRGEAEEEGGEKATVTTQEEITKLYNEYYAELYNRHEMRQEASENRERDEEMRRDATERIINRVRAQTSRRASSEAMEHMTVEAIIADNNLDEAMKEVKKGTIPGKSGSQLSSTQMRR